MWALALHPMTGVLMRRKKGRLDKQRPRGEGHVKVKQIRKAATRPGMPKIAS